VLSTNPAANAQVAENTPIDMVVSGGPGNVSVPTLVGLNQDQALTALTTAGLQLGTLTDKDSPQPVGQVLDSNPKAGASVVKGSKVDLVLSDGKSGVPKVVGETSVQAQADLTNAGFKPQVIIVVTTSAPDGQVISQNPVAGTALAQGKIVTITVAQAPPPPTTPPPTTPPPTATPTPTKT
jgi:serine/threonine-protein kinase